MTPAVTEDEVATLEELQERRAAALEQKAEEEAEAKRFVPGEGDAGDEAQVATLETKQELREIFSREEELEQEIEELTNEINQLVGEDLLPAAVEDEANALNRLVAALAELGEAVPEPYRAVVEARREYQETQRERQRIEAAWSGAEGETARRQSREIKSYLKSLARDASPEAVLGFVLLQVLDWTRRGSGLQGWWSEEHEIEPLSGSVLQDTPPLPESNLVWNLMKHGTLPVVQE